jgi:hypothetical protein
MEVVMDPSQVRETILEQHVNLREQLVKLRALAAGSIRDDPKGAAPLREEGLRLLAELASHLDFEDLHLLPALRETDAWGDDRATQLALEHAEQRELFRYILARLHETDRPSLLMARELETLVDALLVDMAEEEKVMLRKDVLRDDVVGIDVETG